MAALAVLFHHVEQLKSMQGMPSLWKMTFVRSIGGNAVAIFFALSGFLITYLLLLEKNKSHTVHLGKFYMRRILRIWPLYFLLLLIGVVVNAGYHGDAIGSEYLYFLFFVPNILIAKGVIVEHIAHLWSIGVEEQFYIFWPNLVKFLKTRTFGLILILIAIGFWFLRNYLTWQGTGGFWLKLLSYTRFDFMALGGLGALTLNEASSTFRKLKKILENRIVQAILLLFVLVYLSELTQVYKLYYFDILLFGTAVSGLLVGLVSENRLFNAEQKIFVLLGELSYGIYMYHAIVVYFIIYWLKPFLVDSGLIVQNFIIYFSAIFISVGISYLSYNLFEKRFLALKRKFAIIKSSNKSVGQ